MPIRRKKLDKNGETRIVTSQNDKKEFVIDCDVKERSINFNRNEIKETALSDENQGKYSPHDREISDNYSTSTDLSHEITETDKPDKFSTSTVLASENTKAEEPDKSSESTILASENTETEETNNLIKLSTPSEFEQRDCFNAIEIENIKITLMGLNEKQRREFLYLKSREIKNGIIYIAKNFCISTRTLYRAKRDILNNKFCMTDHNRIRVEGGGRKKKEEKTPNIKIILKEIIDPSTYGDPNSELRWTSFSLRKLKTELAKSLIKTSHTTISRLLKDMGISRKKNKKYHQVGKESPFREHQFLFIQSNTEVAKEQGIPVISIDCMKKILLGNYSNSGTIYTLKDQNILTNDHDFVNDDHKISPFGIYCLNNNTGFINLGQSHDTSQFASNSIISWWINLGQYQFNDAREILVLCDTGGSNRSAGQMWKENLYIASEVLKLKINVCHYPTGCSKYNPIEHRMFSYIAINWQGIPLENIDLVANLICGTTTSSGLFIKCSIDKNRYELNNKLFTKEEFRELPIFYNEWLPKWNYAININKFS